MTTKNKTAVDRKSDTELVVTRTFDGSAEIVFKAWTTPELLMRWWAPRSFGIKLVECDIDLRAGGKYRYKFAVGDQKTMEFFGIYKEVERAKRLVWTNEEDKSGSITTATFVEKDGKTTLILSEVFPTKEALDADMSSEKLRGTDETFAQLDELLASPKG